ncbi:hypothetical protein NQ317_002262 [Molorchus minor]|uniref:Cation/H+ exchanger transmembrane domain-containing protein n=1 Tax=Molorchus minor TaxID=1323400 RepID=A0ABQ9JX12_9CUCU|nr:hypothetical protein NQ317_002262 [Molorchus minor]
MPHLTSQAATRKISSSQDTNGIDNLSFEHPHFRKISTNSNLYQEDRMRKKHVNPDHFRNDIIEYGDHKIKKISVAESELTSKGLDTVVEEDDADRSWWYNFCLKCSTTDEGKRPWEPNWWQRLFPHPFWPSYRKFSRILCLILIGILTWIVVYTVVGETAAPPDGRLYQLIVLSICAHLGGWLMGLTTFPPLVGMLFTGILFQNIGAVDIDEEFSEITSELGHMALVIILIRAGLDLDPAALQKLKFTVLKLSLIPWCVESIAVMILAKFLLNMSWAYAVLLGSIISAVSPAVVVPCLFRLRSKGYGVAKGIPTLIIAVASIDDAASVAIFGIIKSFMFSDSSLINNAIFGPLLIVAGIAFGVLWGMLCNFIPERNDPFTTPLRVLLVLTGGMGAVFGSEYIGYGGAGPLGCVTAAFVAMACWSKHGWEVDNNPAATAFEIFWMIIQPALFGVTGAKIKFNELDGGVVGISVGILVAAVVIRIFFTVLVGFGCKLNLKEKIFVSIAWMCKAIVQVYGLIELARVINGGKECGKFILGDIEYNVHSRLIQKSGNTHSKLKEIAYAALGPIALTMVDPGTVEYDYAEKILTTCVLSIVVTAPTGALLTTFLGPQLLTKANLPPLAEVRRRKKSRLSMRDLSIGDEEELTANKHATLERDEVTV